MGKIRKLMHHAYDIRKLMKTKRRGDFEYNRNGDK